uniref:Plastidic glucose transporter 4-like n=2 Tax=Tetraselmis sp. GSL018 TaxID=582737 RepID=A0A061R7X9_9CHLO
MLTSLPRTSVFTSSRELRNDFISPTRARASYPPLPAAAQIRAFSPLQASMQLPTYRRKEPAAFVRQVATHASASDSAGGLEGGGPGNTNAAVKTSLAPVLFSVAIASMGAIEFGYHIAILNGPLELIASQLGFAGQQAMLGGVVSSFLAGAAIGALTGSNVADAAGRKKGLVISSLPLVAGAVLMALASSFPTIIAGRFVTGLGVGLSSCMVPIYIAEVAPTFLRGALGSVTQIGICSGILIAQVVNLILGVEAWRTMMAVAAGPAAVLLLGMGLVCPESPRYLASKGRREQADKAAAWLWGKGASKNLQSSGGSGEQQDQEKSVPFSELFKGRNLLVATIAFMMFLFQQFSGVNAVFFFSGSVFKQAGIESVALANAVTGLVNLLGTIAAAGIIERLGRKTLLCGSFTGQGICMLLMGLALAIPAFEAIRTPIVLLGTILYILCFSVGCGPIPALLVPELSPERIRGLAVSLAMTSHWTCNFMVGQLFLPLVDAVGISGVYYFFAFTCLCAVIFTTKLVIETKGRSLEEIEAIMYEKK